MNIIELKNITKTYHIGKIDVPVLRGVSFVVEQGEFVAIMGHSGSGKSTLLYLIGLLDRPTSGDYLIAGKSVNEFSDDELAVLRNHFIGFVFQNFNLLPRLSAFENVLLPTIYSHNNDKNTGKRVSKNLWHQTAYDFLKKTGLGDRLDHKPAELSGGQQQRVAISRALVTNPLLILADEPTGNLDSASSAEIMNIFKKLNREGMTIIMVTHETDIANYADRLIRLKDGVVLSDERKKTSISSSSYSPHEAKTAGLTSQQNSGASFARVGENYAHIIPSARLDFRKIKDYITEAYISIKSNRTRSMLSILGVLIGVASVIAMLSLGSGAREDVKKRISSLGSNLLMVRPSSPRLGGVSLETGTSIKLDLQDVKEISTIKGVVKVAPYVTGRGQVVYGNKNWNTRVEGTSPEFFDLRNSWPERGRAFTAREMTSRAKVALIGKTVARELFGDNDPIGEFIKIKRIDFLVIGILPEKGSSGWRDEDDRIVIPINTAMYRLLGKTDVEYMDVQVASQEEMSKVSEEIIRKVALLHRLPQSRGDVIDIRNMADLQKTIAATTTTFTWLLGSIAFVSLLVGGIGIMNIMLVTVTERTREIGLRKSVGASKADILFQFVIEAMTICILGGFAGIIVGALVSFAISRLAGWTTLITLPSIFLSVIFSVGVGAVFGIWPAKKAADLNPIEALRYE